MSLSLLVENRAEELMASGIFKDFIASELLRVIMCWESSSAISRAELSLLQNPELPVALVLNCSGPPEEFRAPVENILRRDAPRGPWHLALAIPDMTTWLRLDPTFASALANSTSTNMASKVEIAVFFKDWSAVASNRVDRDSIASRDREFEALHRFIGQHCLSSTSVA